MPGLFKRLKQGGRQTIALKASAEPVNPVWEAGLYLRLSKDDKGVQESASIENQRKMLVAYADENRFRIAGVYIDDGYSGTNFDEVR